MAKVISLTVSLVTIECKGGIMNIEQVKEAIAQGKTVCVGSEAYQVKQAKNGLYNIVCKYNSNCVGLTWLDGKTLNCKESELFINERV